MGLTVSRELSAQLRVFAQPCVMSRAQAGDQNPWSGFCVGMQVLTRLVPSGFFSRPTPFSPAHWATGTQRAPELVRLICRMDEWRRRCGRGEATGSALQAGPIPRIDHHETAS